MNKEILSRLRDRLDAALESGTPEAYADLAPDLVRALEWLTGAGSSAPTSGDELGRALQALEDAWIKGRAPSGQLPGSPEHQARLSQLIEAILQFLKLTIALAKGDLSQELGVKGMMAGGLKALQANLRHLTWQTQMIAGGDFNQCVDFMGDFSEAFNFMVTSLASARNQLKQRSEELTQANETLRVANQDLEAFGYSVSHDLRAPLRAIGGYARIIMEEDAEQLNPESFRLLKGISDNTKKMAKLIDDLLAFSRLGRQEMKKTIINMTALTQEIVQELKVLTPERRLNPSINPLPEAYGDYSLLRQVMVNLLTNAFKFTASRETAVIEVGGRSEGDETIFYVNDNGVGFDMKYEAKLFGVFQRLHQASEFEGTGVGLSIVQRIVQRHGGRVWAKSQVNKGATFSFSLPKIRED